MARKLSGHDKAAILLMSVGEEAASEIMKTLDPKDLRKIGGIITNTTTIPLDEIETVLGEFSQQLQGTSGMNLHGKAFVQKALTKALGPERATQVLDDLGDTNTTNLDYLKWMDPKIIANTIRNEHPQVIALILSHLDPDQSSQVLAHLPESLRSQALLRMATIEEVPPGIMQEVNDVLISEFSRMSTVKGRKISGTKMVADILNQMDRSSEQKMMETLGQENAELAERVRSLMFVFDDLAKLDDRALQELLKEINKDHLTIAFKAAKEEVKTKFYKNMSARAAEMFQEDLEAKGPIKLSEVEKAQQEILKVAQKLAEEGKIAIANKGGETDVLV